MAVTIKKVDKAIEEANRFITIAGKARERLSKDRYAQFGCRETGAVRRASMDLSQALVDIRRTD